MCDDAEAFAAEDLRQGSSLLLLLFSSLLLWNPEMEIRNAVTDDAPTACLVLRRSIVELCVADHRNDPEILARWLNNKTPEQVASWISQQGYSMFVATDSATMLGVGMITDAGDIHLLYVSPDARFRGVSKALLGALEERSRQLGNARCSVISSETARRFYLAADFIEEEERPTILGVRGYRMLKLLTVGT